MARCSATTYREASHKVQDVSVERNSQGDFGEMRDRFDDLRKAVGERANQRDPL